MRMRRDSTCLGDRGATFQSEQNRGPKRTSRSALRLVPDRFGTVVSSNEHDCNGLFLCPAIDYFDQQGDYEGLVA